MPSIRRLLVANRGEIACRVMRTASGLGIETVAVYSDADRDALHVRTADQAVHIGAAPVGESYLVIEKIIAAAVASGADAIHPGYGFLSENAAFARACADADIIFVGPTERAIDLMGDKARAKRAMIAADVPCVPGYQDEDQRDETLSARALEIGFPIMIKAAAGGGGRGMRLVHEEAGLANAIETARSEAVSAFGNGELILEKAVLHPRHVEVQVFGDTHGNIVHLGERDCSVQRRHQKVIEEAPCPVMTPALRDQMGKAAVDAARAVDYVGAGTVEFLLDETGTFYFLEMNTRLQVEHPVTECVTGLDLVALQLCVASGEPLGIDQSDVTLDGHAIEVRLYAEDARSGFLPSTGDVALWLQPEGSGVRVDGGVESGDEVSPHYDPMIAKVIGRGRNREEARRQLSSALGDSLLVGPVTNRDFLLDALSRGAFIEGAATTAFIDQEYGEAGFIANPTIEDLALAALTQFQVARSIAIAESAGVDEELLGWSSNVPLESVFTYDVAGARHTLRVHPAADRRYRVVIDESIIDIELIAMDANRVRIEIEGRRRAARWFAPAHSNVLHLATERITFSVEDVSSGRAGGDAAGDGQVVAPMHGMLIDVFVGVGQQVRRGDRLALLEAMKMQHEILAEIDGCIAELGADAGTQVAMGDALLRIEPTADD